MPARDYFERNGLRTGPMVLARSLCRSSTIGAAVEEYMRQLHIPEIFGTGCFRRIRFSLASGTRFRATYQADG